MESTNDPRPSGWSSDGRVIFDWQIGPTSRDIGVLTVESDRAVEMLLETEFVEQTPALSPDGRWLAYQSDESGQSEIYVQPFPNIDDGKWQVSTDGGFDPVWSPDGQALFFIGTQPGQIMVTEVETEPTFNPDTPTRAFALSGYDTFGPGRQFDLPPDGERFLLRMVAGAQNATADESFDGLIFVENWFQELTERVPVN